MGHLEADRLGADDLLPGVLAPHRAERRRSLTVIRATAAWVRQAFYRYHAREISHEQLRAVIDQHRGPTTDPHRDQRYGIVDSDTPIGDT